MPQIHLKQPTSLNKSGSTYNASGLFTKSKERLKKIYANRKYNLCLQKWSR